MKIIILGGTGLIGKALVKKLIKKNHEVWVFAKNPYEVKSIDPKIKTTFWRAGQNINPYFLKGVDVIVNLAGTPIDLPWNTSNKKEILESRILPIEDIISGLKYLQEGKNLPAYIGASAIGYYPYSDEKTFSLGDKPGVHFLSQVCSAWEDANLKHKNFFSRIVLIRTGIVLSSEGGFEKKVSGLIKKGLGTCLGKGENFLSTIKLSEIVRLYEEAIENPYKQGIINGVSKVDTQINILNHIAKKYNTKIKFFIPSWLVKILFKEQSEMLLSSQKIEIHSDFKK